MEAERAKPEEHSFASRPHGTLLRLSFPVLISLIAEPLTGLVDTAFVMRLGSGAMTALGVGSILLSSSFWIFNFLGISTQTEVAHATGSGTQGRAAELCGFALVLAAGFGLLMALMGALLAHPAAAAMGASPEVEAPAVVYLRIRLLAAPAVIAMTVCFGALRGLQDMRTPLWIAVSVNLLNIALDAVLIFGWGFIPALGIAGAAWATVVAHWLGVIWALVEVRHRLGKPAALHGRDARRLLVVGGDLFVRTGLLSLFLILTTRAATTIGKEAGSAHHAIRQVWLFTALVLDAFAASAQSLVGYFLGAKHRELARRVARLSCGWSLGTGVALALGMLLLEGPVARWLVPEDARDLFGPAWRAAALAQPLNALSFATDGLHWGTRDFRYLRNAMVLATGVGAAGIWWLDEAADGALTWVWIVTALWITVRAVLGVARIWPGIGRAPLAGTAA